MGFFKKLGESINKDINNVNAKIQRYEQQAMGMSESQLIAEYKKALMQKDLYKATGYKNAMRAQGIDYSY